MRSPILHLPKRNALAPLREGKLLEGVLLLAATAGALVWANLPWGESYSAVWGRTLTLGAGEWTLSKPLVVWINDALMAVFFLLVGLEIKREVLAGELSTLRRAALPVAAALGGMIAPALLFLSVNWGGPAESGWAVPMATDIAFALGLFALFASGAPLALKVLLAAVAITDDIGAILVIALFYTADLATWALGWAAGAVAVLVVMNRAGVRSAWPYLLVGSGLWLAVLESGVHATVAGVLLAFTIPMRAGGAEGEGPSLLHRLEHRLHAPVALGIVPLFALANAGVALDASVVSGLLQPLGLGIGLGLVVGKQAGILSFAWLAVRLGVAELPKGVTWRHVHAMAALCGIGFTMALFIAQLAFTNPEMLDQAKAAILVASMVSALTAYVLLRARAGEGSAVRGGPEPRPLAPAVAEARVRDRAA